MISKGIFDLNYIHTVSFKSKPFRTFIGNYITYFGAAISIKNAANNAP